MRATIDKAGRLVVPKLLRDHLGLQPGEVEVTADGAGLRVEALAGQAAFETFSVLTRLPPPARKTPATVARSPWTSSCWPEARP